MSRGFLLDLERCTGCSACGLACTIENDLDPGVSWRQIVTFNEPRYEAIPSHHLSLACNHCDDAPCMSSCPALAYRRDPGTGAVLIEADRCIGCGYCAWACPYDAPRLDSTTGVMTKCTLCQPRLEVGEFPACVSGCPTDALRFGDLEEGDGETHARGFPRADVGARIRFLREKPGSDSPDPFPPGPVQHPIRPEAPKIRLASEWPLALFTMLTAWLVAGVVAQTATGLPLSPLAFLGAAMAGMALSTAHLGRPLRAWRAVLNLRSSWLSREVALYGLFVALSTVALLAGNRAAGWTAGAAGFACLFAMDRVYDVVRRPGGSPHSAEVLLSGGFLTAVLMGSEPAAVLLGGFRLALYLWRKTKQPGRRPLASALRVSLGWILPGLVAWLGGPWSLALAGLVAGELIDRLEFYAELDVSTPRRQAVLDLQDLARRGPAYN